MGTLFADLPRTDRDRLEFVKNLWESGRMTDNAPALEIAVSTLLGVAERFEAGLAEIAEYVDSPGRPVLALMARERLRV